MSAGLFLQATFNTCCCGNASPLCTPSLMGALRDVQSKKARAYSQEVAALVLLPCGSLMSERVRRSGHHVQGICQQSKRRRVCLWLVCMSKRIPSHRLEATCALHLWKTAQAPWYGACSVQLPSMGMLALARTTETSIQSQVGEATCLLSRWGDNTHTWIVGTSSLHLWFRLKVQFARAQESGRLTALS